MHRLGECDHCCVVSEYHNTRVKYVLYGIFSVQNKMPLFLEYDVELGLVFYPETMKGSLDRNEHPIHNDWRQ